MEVRAQGYTFDIRADDLCTVVAPTTDNLLMEQSGKICLSTQEHAPQKVLAYSHTMHELTGQSLCTPRPS